MPSTVTAGIAANVVGLAGIAASTIGAGGERVPADQLGWLSLGIAGLLIALSADLAIVFAGRRRLAGHRGRLGRLPTARPISVAPRVTSDECDLVAVAGGRRFHRPGCSLVVGKTATAEVRAELERGGRMPCGVCRP